MSFNFAILVECSKPIFSHTLSLCECYLPIMGKYSLFLFLKIKVEEGNNFLTACICNMFYKSCLKPFRVNIVTEIITDIASSQTQVVLGKSYLSWWMMKTDLFINFSHKIDLDEVYHCVSCQEFLLTHILNAFACSVFFLCKYAVKISSVSFFIPEMNVSERTEWIIQLYIHS